MKLLLDQGLPRNAAHLLTQAGLDTVHVSSLGMAAASDEEILRKAIELDRAAVTLDADFHSLMALSGALRPSVVRIRIEGLKAQDVTTIMLMVVAQCKEDFEAALVTVTEKRIRLKKLPV